MDTKTLTIIILIPVISALIGWFTNYLAIKSLFRPKKRTKILFFKIQGVIPKRKKVLTNRIATVVEDYLFSKEDIAKIFQDKKNLKKIKKDIVPIIETKFLEKVPVMFQSMAQPIISKILNEETDEIISKIGDEVAKNTINNINIKKIVKDKLENYDVENIEKIIYAIANKELKHIEYLGAVIGFIIGLVQIGLLLLL